MFKQTHNCLNFNRVFFVRQIERFKKDEGVNEQLKTGDTIGCFYIESPAMRGLLKKLRCSDYLTLVAASSIIRPGVAKSGMMKQYIYRFHNPNSFEYLHPIMKEQLSETYGVMVYQEDVLKIAHHFGGLDLADADVLRRMMSGKKRDIKKFEALKVKFFKNCKDSGHSYELTSEVWRLIESFAGYSFSKAHSASYAVQSYQSLYLKTYYPLEFIVGVINNFGGFYRTWVYVEEARNSGGNIHLPCVNNSLVETTLYGSDIYLGFQHLKSLNAKDTQTIVIERLQNGAYSGLEDFMQRTQIGLQAVKILIRIHALRFTGKNKRELLWEAHMLFNKEKHPKNERALFYQPPVEWKLPKLTESSISNAYDEIELLGFPVMSTRFDLLTTSKREHCKTTDLLKHVNQTVRMMGNYVDRKRVTTVKGEEMNFGTFLDEDRNFFDTVNFPPSLKAWPFTGMGVYLIEGKVTEEFGFPSIEVQKMARLSVKSIPVD